MLQEEKALLSRYSSVFVAQTFHLLLVFCVSCTVSKRFNVCFPALLEMPCS